MIVMIEFDMCLFLLYVSLYYLWTLFVFVGKNIDWRLPSMELAVSIITNTLNTLSMKFYTYMYAYIYILYIIYIWYIYKYIYVLYIYVYIKYIYIYLYIYIYIIYV